MRTNWLKMNCKAPSAMMFEMYPELLEPVMTFQEILSILTRMTDEELNHLCEDTFATALIAAQ